MSIQIKQKSTYIGHNQWDWSVWLSGPASELDQIDHVTYTLHPTFSNPARQINTRKGGFRLKSSGWGEFTIYIDIAQKDGEHFQLRHDLKLKTEPTRRSASDNKNIDQHIVSATNSSHQETMPVLKGIVKTSIRSALIKSGEMDEVAEHLPKSTIFISGCVANAVAIHRLRKSLEKLNVRILSADEILNDIPFQIHIEKMIDQASMAVFLVSGRPSMWVNQEIEFAKRYGKRIVPVLIGSDSALPESLQGFNSLHFDKLESIADLAQEILKLLD